MMPALVSPEQRSIFELRAEEDPAMTDLGTNVLLGAEVSSGQVLAPDLVTRCRAARGPAFRDQYARARGTYVKRCAGNSVHHLRL